ncbi:MAG: hypothetical protein K9G59_12680 [Caulobacter sp.]|nr:hypothetical protein [Caulobacter sp.]
MRAPEVLAPLVFGVSEVLGLHNGDVQFALSKARVFGDRAWSMEDQLGVRSAIWRQRLFGAPARGRPGTVVKVRASGWPTRPAYLRRPGRPSWVIYDTGPGICGDFEVVTPRSPLPDFVPTRLWLPYGYWNLRDGSEVVFSRDYFPLWRVTNGVVERLEPWYWIKGIVRTTHFTTQAAVVDWTSALARRHVDAYLAQHRILGLPRLVDAMPHLFEHDVETMSAAVARFHERCGEGAEFPDFARMNTMLAVG